MAFEPDRVVVELIAKLDQFDTPIKQSATTFDQSMNKITASATKAETAVTATSGRRIQAIKKESAEISRASQIIGTQINDIGALLQSPKSPFVIVPKQAPQVAGAMRMVSLGTSALGGVLGGILVTGALAGAAALYELILKSNDTTGAINDLVEGLKEQAEKSELARKAGEIFRTTLEGIEVALNAAEAARKKATEGLRSYAENANIAAQQNLKLIDGHYAAAEAALEHAKGLAAVAAQQTFGAAGGAGAQGAQQFFARQVEEIEKRLENLKAARKGFQKELEASRKDLAEEAGKRAADPLAQLNRQYDKEVKAAKSATAATIEQTNAIARQVRAIEERRKAAIKEFQESQRKTREPRGEFGRQVSASEAAGIARAAGLLVNSATRSFAEQKALYDRFIREGRPKDRPVAPPGTSAHEGARGRWALDIQLTKGLTPDLVRKIFAAKGVTISKAIKEHGGRVLHIEGSTSQSDSAARFAETEARRRQAAADAAERRQQAYQNELASLQADELAARHALVTTPEEISQIELASIEISRKKYADNVASLVTQRKLTADEAKELLTINEERAKLRAELVKRREAERQFRTREEAIERQNAVQAGGLQAQQELLQSQQGIARTQRERLEIGQRLVRLQFQEERLALEAAVARAARLRAEYTRTKSQETLAELERAEADAAIAKQRLGTIDQREGAAQQGNAQVNASPLQSYFSGIQAQADDLNSAFEMIAANGLQNFEDKLTDAIVNFKSLGDVGRAVLQGVTADLVRLAIRLVLNATIGRLLGKVAAVSTAAAAATAAAAWAPAAALASLATLGANAGPAAAAMASTAALAAGIAATSAAGGVGGAFAEGGSIIGPGGPTDDKVLIAASNGEFMIRARSARKIGYSALDHLNRTGEMPRFAQGGVVRRVSPRNEAAVAPGRGGFSSSDINTLRGIIGEAVSAGVTAMPDVSLYTSFDPVDVLQRALATPSGQKALVAALGANASKVNTTLGGGR